MANLTNQQKIHKRQAERRQQQWERKYQKKILTFLSVQYRNAAKEYQSGYTPQVDTDRLERLLTELYTQVTINEAKKEYDNVLAPIMGELRGRKDIIDNLVSLLTSNSDDGVVKIWRNLLGNFLNVRIATRLSAITDTTKKNLTRLIEKGINEGLGAEEVAKRIRKESRGELNRVRSRAIARTETVTAQNQGKYMAAASSDYEMLKAWSPVVDSRTRLSHLQMDNERWIDLNDDFYLQNMQTGELEPALYPGDNRLGAANTVSCRCTLITKPKRRDGRLVRK